MDKTVIYYQKYIPPQNKDGQYVYHQCQDVQVSFSNYPNLGTKHEHRCGLDAMWTVTSWLPLSGQWHTKLVCDLCLSHYLERFGNKMICEEN